MTETKYKSLREIGFPLRVEWKEPGSWIVGEYVGQQSIPFNGKMIVSSVLILKDASEGSLFSRSGQAVVGKEGDTVGIAGGYLKPLEGAKGGVLYRVTYMGKEIKAKKGIAGSIFKIEEVALA